MLQPFLLVHNKDTAMERCILNPERSKGDPELPATGILAVNPSDTQWFAACAEQAGLNRSFLFNSNLYSSDAFFLAGPAVGAPMAVLCLEKLIALGAENIILYGWCGSLHKNLHAMDVLVPTHALIEEGTSNHYLPGEQTVLPSSPLAGMLRSALSEEGISVQHGPVWTTDAPYRETRHKVIAYGEQGIVAVDMEYSALCTVALHRQVRLAAVMLVSDELCRLPWKPSYSFKKFKQRSGELLTLLCEIAGTEQPR